MRQKNILFILLLLLNGADLLFSQGSFITQDIELLTTSSLKVSANTPHEFSPVKVDFNREIPFLNIVLKIDERNDSDVLNNCWIRYSNDGSNWSNYQQVLKDSHEPSYTSRLISDLMYADATTQYVQLKVMNKPQSILDFSSIQLLLSAPSTDDRIYHTTNSQLRDGCELPAMEARGEWCSLSECPVISGGAWTDVSHLIVHHSAGSSTSSNWPAVVRSIWHYHVDTRGWDDIGYNWLIDANGVLYEGRPDNIRGAHMCGHNTGTMGVCVLGNFETAQVTNEALGTLQGLLAWKSEQKSLDPTATVFHSSSQKNLKTISGHKDGCNPGYTECPGKNFYPKLVNIRKDVDTLLQACIAGIHDNQAKNSIRLFSNLVSDQLIIMNLNSSFEYEIFGSDARKYLAHKKTNNPIIDINQLQNGTYFIRLNVNKNLIVHRFIVHK